MPTPPAVFREAEIARIIRAARKEGLDVAGVRYCVLPDGGKFIETVPASAVPEEVQQDGPAPW